jgi:hypothetical protein
MGDFEESLGDLKIFRILSATALRPSTPVDSRGPPSTVIGRGGQPSTGVDKRVTGSGTAEGACGAVWAVWAVVWPTCADADGERGRGAGRSSSGGRRGAAEAETSEGCRPWSAALAACGARPRRIAPDGDGWRRITADRGGALSGGPGRSLRLGSVRSEWEWAWA